MGTRATRPCAASAARARPSLAERPAVGIVHLGIGAFHRAHQAVYTADAVERAGGDWGILGVAQRRPAAVDALGPQDGLFSVARARAGGGRGHGHLGRSATCCSPRASPTA